MPAALGLGFLLPIGLWLIMTAAAREDEGRAASAGALAVAAATLAFGGLGFALMFGGVGVTRGLDDLRALSSYVALPAAGGSWGIAGLSGFGLAAADQPMLRLFTSYLPLVQSAALCAAGASYRRASWLRQALIAAAIGGLALPLPGFWLWGGGWLASMGLSLGFGHGALDVGGLGLAGVVGGVAAGVWLMLGPRRDTSADLRLPASGRPMRAFVGAPMALIGAISLTSVNPLFSRFLSPISDMQAINVLLAAGAAAVSAQAYAVFVSRRPDALLSARAMLAATIALSAGGAFLSPLVAGLTGALLGAAWPIVHHVVAVRLCWPDDEATMATVLVPAVVGMLLPGVFATGVAGAGLNGVGHLAYLGVTGLGVVGLVAPVALPDTGQFTAQAVAVLATLAFAGVVASAVTWPFRRAVGHVAAPLAESPVAGARPNEPLSAPAAPDQTAGPPALPREDAPDRPAPVRPRSVPATPQSSQPGEGIIARLRRMKAERQRPPAPQQARKVAYPSRVAGKRLFARPLAEPPSKPEDTRAEP